jgi:hypothetical protein
MNREGTRPISFGESILRKTTIEDIEHGACSPVRRKLMEKNNARKQIN